MTIQYKSAYFGPSLAGSYGRGSAPNLSDSGRFGEQAIPMLEILQAQTAQTGPIEALVADTGYCSEKNVEASESLGITPFIAVAREEHHPDWRQRHTEPEDLPENATRMQAMMHRLKTQAGRSVYRLRKQTVEPVFGIIKSVMGFR
ncbi:transposase, partial [Acidithiobacillus thiooxidans]|uniref:transposase n=1 Tax=Acidithiobacillus thiooxidans TaxID=930 RepID=UPI00130155A2